MGWREKNRPIVHIFQRREYWGWLGTDVWVLCGPWHGKKRTRGRYYRRFKRHRTLIEFDREFSRLKRSPSRMPESYDDHFIKYQRSWKSHRKTQHKPKDIRCTP